ncbi:MAG: hypothetical protein K9L74_05920 [Candidatus Izimaplasma sp.]|nr:hypothetical protein [Candidatus Izimaplasma bacterium]
MKKLKRKPRVEQIVDDKSKLEKKFEEKGKKIGRETGKIVQESINTVKKAKSDFTKSSKVKKIKSKVRTNINKAFKKVKKQEKSDSNESE